MTSSPYPIAGDALLDVTRRAMSDIVLRFFITASRGLIEIPNWSSKNVTRFEHSEGIKHSTRHQGVVSVNAAGSSRVSLVSFRIFSKLDGKLSLIPFAMNSAASSWP